MPCARPRRSGLGRQDLAVSTGADGVKGVDQELDVFLGGDQGWGEAEGLAVCLLGENALVEQLLADVPAGAQLGADVDAGPQPPGPHRIDALADELPEAGSQLAAEGLGALLELTGVQ